MLGIFAVLLSFYAVNEPAIVTSSVDKQVSDMRELEQNHIDVLLASMDSDLSAADDEFELLWELQELNLLEQIHES